MKKEKRRIWRWLLLALVLLIPVHVHMTDGGSEGWHAILWQVDHCHEFSDKGFLVGTRVSLLFGLIPVYDDTHEEPMKPEPTEAPAPAETRTNVPEPTADAAPYLVEEESFFSDFVIQKDAVYGTDKVVFLCRLTIRNPSDTPMPVKISGDFSADAEAGLIWGQGLYALRLDEGAGADFFALDAAEREAILQDRSRLLFLLQPGDNAFWVVFSGLHGESSVKQDRLLPKIRLSPLTDVTPEEVSAAMDCRIFKDPDLCDAYLLDRGEIFALGVGFFGGCGFTSAVPFDYGFNEVPDLLFTYSFGSGMHRSHLALFDRTTKKEQELYVYYPSGADGDLLVELEQDGYPAVVYTADVTVNGGSFTDLLFTKREKAGEVVFVLAENENFSGPRFLPDGNFIRRSGVQETAEP